VPFLRLAYQASGFPPSSGNCPITWTQVRPPSRVLSFLDAVVSNPAPAGSDSERLPRGFSIPTSFFFRSCHLSKCLGTLTGLFLSPPDATLLFLTYKGELYSSFPFFPTVPPDRIHVFPFKVFAGGADKPFVMPALEGYFSHWRFLVETLRWSFPFVACRASTLFPIPVPESIRN